MYMPANKRVAAVVGLGIAAVVVCVIALIYKESGKEQPIASVRYSCDASKTIDASFFSGSSAQAPTPKPGQPPTPTGYVQISLSDGRAMTLPQTISADGARYANDDESFVFWSKGNGALVLERSQEKSFIGCVQVAADPGSLPAVYSSGAEGFSIRLPSLSTSTPHGDASDYSVDERYAYQELGPGKDIGGVKFTIPGALAAGTNLGADSYLSVEEIPLKPGQTCSARRFLDAGALPLHTATITDAGVEYSMASSTGAGAGNRYEETVYALPGTNPCMAVRYFIHYGVFENYPAGAVRPFDEQGIIKQFDVIRRTLVVNQ